MSKATPRTSQAPRRQKATPLRWPKTTELLGLRFSLQPSQDAVLYPQYAIALHAWFLHQVKESNPKLSALMHDHQEEKNFTLTRLHGPLLSQSRGIGISANESYEFVITAFSLPVVQWMSQWVKQLPDAIPIRDTNLLIRNVSLALPPMTYTKLWRAGKQPLPTLALHFDSPTSFRSRGHHLPLPIPRNLFQSYLRRWNVFAQRSFEIPPFLDWVERSVILHRHQISSVKTAGGKRGSVTGFMGSIELGIVPKAQADEYAQLLSSLVHFAPYCGTGHKTTFGLGVTRLGWEDHWQFQVPTAADQLLSERIDVLTTQFKALRKRQGGSRATQAAQLWATVLARREVGDSLDEIAHDLEIPYESAKTYSKLARRALRDG